LEQYFSGTAPFFMIQNYDVENGQQTQKETPVCELYLSE
jgi:hypothetical protein